METWNCKECGNEERSAKYFDGEKLFPLCFDCDHWLNLLSSDRQSIIIDGHHYMVGSEGGFAGYQFLIKMNSGQEIITTRLWHQGCIPNRFKPMLPDNASCDQLAKRSHYDR